MGVYIKGMEMPNNCHECELVDILPTCPCKKMADEDFWNNVSLAVEGHKDCPLSEVKTPHRRLIEEPELFHYGGLAKISPLDCIGTAKYFFDQVKAMPTIIEAEE